ncbi:MAG TPA: dephospho-CoA kinase [Burkholderiaceae bacterium]|nr:dephospho-CoA kinase [Burkholderiaceae bacterium]
MDAAGLSPAPPLRIGLTGGIGSGKSTVARLLGDLGAALVDTDRIARELTEPGGAAVAPIAAAFGAEMIDASGALDRARMRELVFSDAAAKQRLEAILHPLIGLETARQASLAAGAPAIVFDVPLLVESAHWRGRVDKVLVVDCREATQIERVVARSGWRADAVQAVINGQASRAQRRAAADAVIANDTLALDALAAQVATVWRRWLRPGA